MITTKYKEKEIEIEVCPTTESKMQLVRIAATLRDPNTSVQDLYDLMNPKKEGVNDRT